MIDRRLTIYLFGAPRIVLGETPIKIQRRTTFALLVYLALTRRAHAREALIALIAGELDDRRARHAFRNALAELRQQLGDYVVLRGETIALDTARAMWIDVGAFEAAVTTPSGTPDVADLEAAAALYQDDLLAGFVLPRVPAFDDWIVRERLRLHALLVRALQTLLDVHMKRRALGAALEAANRLLAIEPWREEVHRDLMRVLTWSGQRSAAIEQYEICRRVLHDELRIEPDPETSALRAQLGADAAAPPNNLPPRLSSLLGRESELEALRELVVDPACRLITILGLGGIGKSRLALELAAELSRPATLLCDRRFPDGVYVVSLAEQTVLPAADRNAAAAALARAIAAAVFPGEVQRDLSWSAIVRSLRARRMLLVLDNVEQVQAGRELLSDLLYHAPQCTLLATSRLRLGLEQEWVLELHGLGVPDIPAAVEHSAAGRCFLEHARQAQLSQPLSEADYTQVMRICQAVEGLPLALILAAGSLRLLTCADVARELGLSFDLLESPAIDVPERQRSVRASIDWTLRLLAADDQAALRRLAVFKDGFEWQAARDVADVSLRGLRALRDASLLQCDAGGRYRMHRLLHQHISDQFPGRPAAAPNLRLRHAAFYAELVSRHGAKLRSDRVAQALITTEQHNIRSAWEWAIAHHQLDLLEQMREGMAAWFDGGGRYVEGAAFFAAATRLPSSMDGQAHGAAALAVARGFNMTEEAYFLARAGRTERAQALLGEAMEVAHAYGASGLAAFTVFHCGALWVLCGPGDAQPFGLRHRQSESLDIPVVMLEPAGGLHTEAAA